MVAGGLDAGSWHSVEGVFFEGIGETSVVLGVGVVVGGSGVFFDCGDCGSRYELYEQPSAPVEEVEVE